MNLLLHPLENQWLRLEPFAPAHREALRGAAADPAIWRHWPRDVPGAGWDAHFDWQAGEAEARRWHIYAVIDPAGVAVGQTCFLNLRPADSGVEVGGTWYAPAAQATTINPAAKLLMLGHAFACGAERVELKTDALNARSRAAILKLGAQFEGIFRHHMRRADGSWRDTAWYSVIRAEWPRVREGLEARLAA